MDFKLDSKKRQISTSDGAGYLAAGAQLGGSSLGTNVGC